MRFGLDYDGMMKRIAAAEDGEQVTLELVRAIRGLCYLLKICKIEIDEELYCRLDDDGKRYFIASNEHE